MIATMLYVCVTLFHLIRLIILGSTNFIPFYIHAKIVAVPH